MKYPKIIAILFLLLFAGATKVFAQVKVTSYSVHALGTSVALSERFDAELKVFANQWKFENVGIELAGTYKFKPNTFHQFSAGVGLGLLPYSGDNAYVSLPVGLEIFPLQDFKRLSLAVELAPEIFINDDKISLRHLWGIRYAFLKE